MLIQPDYSIPNIHATTPPLTDPSEAVPSDGIIGALSGNYIGAAKCQADCPTAQPPVPYVSENANQDMSSLVENGFKQVRGSLTEGHYLTFEINGSALTNAGKNAPFVTTTKTTSRHENINQRWILHQVGDLYSGNTFQISSAVDGRYISYLQTLTSNAGLAETYTITDLGNGNGYSLKPSGVLSLNVLENGVLTTTVQQSGFQIFSVTYTS